VPDVADAHRRAVAVGDDATPFAAAMEGAGEIGFTIVSITLSLIAVFIPLFLMSGYVGLLFREFAVAVSVALLLSLVISLTLTPMMCAYLLKPESKKHGRLYRFFERGFDGLRDLYEAGLKIVLRHQFVTLMVMLLTVVLTGYLYVVIPKGFFPQQDTGLIIGLSEAAQDISFQAMAERQQALLNAITRDPAVASVGSAVGAGGGNFTVNNGRVFIQLKSANQRDPIDQVKVAPLIINHQGQFPSVTVSFNLEPGTAIGQVVSAIQQVEKDLKPPLSLQTSFQGNAQAFGASLSSTPILIVLRSSLST
jgi:multidrug efflux pump subunit AcrB